ncbi:MAG TPA: DUF5668 domain-containing protein [Bryobacteraceae bacterium]|nr:DUF5668 domain-containing protein [Bryobacteraceae bacterium]
MEETNHARGSESLVRAIRGPIVLITIGTLFAIDHMGGYAFSRTWPVLLIIIGLLKLIERAAAPPVQHIPGPPMQQ